MKGVERRGIKEEMRRGERGRGERKDKKGERRVESGEDRGEGREEIRD